MNLILNMWRSKIGVNLIFCSAFKKNNIYDVCPKRRVATGPVLLANRQKAEVHLERPVARSSRPIGAMGLFLALIPIVTLGLGTWQVKRRKWKQDLIAQLQARSNASPTQLPYDLSELEDLEYRPVVVRGQFDHSQELYLGPRSLIKDGDAASEAGLMSKSGGSHTGYCVVTPFKLADRDLTILVNRGWVPHKLRKPTGRQEGQVEGEVELMGVVRLNEKRSPFTPKSQSDTFLYRDLVKMAEMTGSAPIFLDATEDSTVHNGPIGGQTRVSLRNEHLSYIITWYGLSALTGIMWYRHFILRTRII